MPNYQDYPVNRDCALPGPAGGWTGDERVIDWGGQTVGWVGSGEDKAYTDLNGFAPGSETLHRYLCDTATPLSQNSADVIRAFLTLQLSNNLWIGDLAVGAIIKGTGMSVDWNEDLTSFNIVTSLSAWGSAIYRHYYSVGAITEPYSWNRQIWFEIPRWDTNVLAQWLSVNGRGLYLAEYVINSALMMCTKDHGTPSYRPAVRVFFARPPTAGQAYALPSGVMRLTWTTMNADTYFNAYKVYRGATLLSTSPATYYDVAQANGSSVTYTVSGYYTDAARVPYKYGNAAVESSQVLTLVGVRKDAPTWPITGYFSSTLDNAILNWNLTSPATKYILYYRKPGTAWNYNVDNILPGQVPYELTKAVHGLTAGTWEFKVHAWYPGVGWSDASATVSGVVNGAPNAPILNTPAPGSDYWNEDITFRWTFSDPNIEDTQAAADVSLEVDSGGGSWTQVRAWSITNSENTVIYEKDDPTPLNAGDYRWSARTKDNHNIWGAWSTPNEFEYHGLNTPPYPPSNFSPASGTFYLLPTSGLDVTFSWTFSDYDVIEGHGDSQTSWHIAIYDSDNNIVDQFGLPNTDNTYTYHFTESDQYHWIVTVTDSNIPPASSHSGSVYLTVSNVVTPPSSFTSEYEEGEEGVVSLRLGDPLIWEYVKRFTYDYQVGYHIQIFDDNSDTMVNLLSDHLVYDFNVIAKGYFSNMQEWYPPPGLFAKGGTYYARIRTAGYPVDDYHWSQWSTAVLQPDDSYIQDPDLLVEIFIVDDSTYIVPIADIVHVDEANPGVNYSASSDAYVSWAGDERWTLLRFDQSTTPLDPATGVSAIDNLPSSNFMVDEDTYGINRLVLFANRVSPASSLGPIEIHEIDDDWDEGTVNYTWVSGHIGCPHLAPQTVHCDPMFTYDLDDTNHSNLGTPLYFGGYVAFPSMEMDEADPDYRSPESSLADLATLWYDTGDNYGICLQPPGSGIVFTLDRTPPTDDAGGLVHNPYLVLHIDDPPIATIIYPTTGDPPISSSDKSQKFEWTTLTNDGDEQSFIHIEMEFRDGSPLDPPYDPDPFMIPTVFEEIELGDFNGLGSFHLRPEEEYHWRIRVCNQHEDWGAFTAWEDFDTGALVAPDPPEIITPENGGTVNSITPTISWTFTDPNIGAYQTGIYLKITDNSDGSTVYESSFIGVLANMYTIPSSVGLQWNKDYHLDLAVVDNDDEISNWASEAVPSQSITFFTSRAFWAQCNWEDGPGQDLWSEPDKFSASNNIVYGERLERSGP
jgi:hypothetical protein